MKRKRGHPMARNKAAALPHLPVDLILEIFGRLPLQSIARLSSLSKLYNSLLTGPSFNIKYLLSTSDEANMDILLPDSLDKKHPLHQVFIRRNLSTLSNYKVVSSGVKLLVHVIPNYRVLIYGHCHGLFCLVKTPINHVNIQGDTKHYVELFNPTTNKTYPLSECPPDVFGYDHVNHEYKVVKVMLPRDRLLSWPSYIYSCKNRSWKEIQPFPLNFRGDGQYLGCKFVGGKCYICVYADESDDIGEIVSFDLTREIFEAVPQPRLSFKGSNEDGKIKYVESSLAVLDGKLCVYFNLPDGKFCVLAMKDEGGVQFWSPLYTICKMDIFNRGRGIKNRTLCCSLPIRIVMEDDCIFMLH